jgi:hypothetical protein
MVMEATQGSQQEEAKTVPFQEITPLRKTCSEPKPRIESTKVVEQQPKKEEFNDPFGDFPDFDFEELDKLITKRKQENPPDLLQHDLDILAQQQSFVPSSQEVVQNPRTIKSYPPPPRSYIQFSRYKVVDVHTCTNTFTKTLALASWTEKMLNDDSRSIHRADANGRIRPPREPQVWPSDGMVHLRGEWYHTPLQGGDVIHICSLSGQFKTDKDSLPLILHTCPPSGSDHDDIVLIVNPDMLLTPTTISETVSCTRRAILKNRLGSTGLTCKYSTRHGKRCVCVMRDKTLTHFV